MTQLEPRTPTTSPRPDETGPSPQHREPPFNWRISVGMAIGLLVLFGVLFGLRALHIFPPEPGQDPEIVAARATLGVLQTQTALAPRPTTAAAAAPTSAPAAAATPVPTLLPAQQSATEAQVRSPGSAEVQPAPTAVPTTVQPSAPATLVPNAAGPADAPTEPASPTSDQAEATPVAVNLPADLAAAILNGYSKYWWVRQNATHDPNDQSMDLESVMAGNELAGARKTLAEYRDADEAFDTHVKHTVWITSATNDKAVIVDHYTASSIKLDPETKVPLETNPIPETRTDTFVLQYIDGTWKVVDEP